MVFTKIELKQNNFDGAAAISLYGLVNMVNHISSSFNLLFSFKKFLRNIFYENNEIDFLLYKFFELPLANFVNFFSLSQVRVLTDLFVVDYPGNLKRFHVIYNFLSLNYNSRLNIVVRLNELENLQSITSLFNVASWFEREAYDLFGIFFRNHPDLRRILTDYGFDGHPLRKDFPLTGYFEIHFSDVKKRIVYEAVSLTQEYRYFFFNRQWNSITSYNYE